MVVVKKKKGETVDTLIHRFNRESKESNIKQEVELKVRHISKPKLRKLKAKLKLQRLAQERRRRFQ
ncbi:hypothetical protein KBC70_02410 [Candidatus Woesebacteria bacterium]|jgi:hypothetical protein|nr:hypothetical protein [Candidatus Woesebacteria bacterium]